MVRGSVTHSRGHKLSRKKVKYCTFCGNKALLLLKIPPAAENTLSLGTGVAGIANTCHLFVPVGGACNGQLTATSCVGPDFGHPEAPLRNL